MRVLVTGGAGHIGSHIVERLLARNDEVVVIDNYQTGRRDNLKEHENLKIVEDTIANTQKVFEIFEDFQPEILVHAAASYKDPEKLDRGCHNECSRRGKSCESSKKSWRKKNYLFSDSALLWAQTK